MLRRKNKTYIYTYKNINDDKNIYTSNIGIVKDVHAYTHTHTHTETLTCLQQKVTPSKLC